MTNCTCSVSEITAAHAMPKDKWQKVKAGSAAVAGVLIMKATIASVLTTLTRLSASGTLAQAPPHATAHQT